VYQVTKVGKAALRAPQEQVVDKDAHLKALLMHLIQLGNVPVADVEDCLRHRRRQTSQCALELEQRIDRDDRPIGQQLAASYGLALARAELNWLDDVLTQQADQLRYEEALEQVFDTRKTSDN
jgi:hypothetical protein